MTTAMVALVMFGSVGGSFLGSVVGLLLVSRWLMTGPDYEEEADDEPAKPKKK